MSTLRLFFAIRIPETAISHWEQAQIKLKKEIKKHDFDVKWTIPGNYHVTLCFLGQVSEEKLSFLKSVLTEVAGHYHPFQLNLNGLGAFADVYHARILYLGVQNKKILRALQNEIVELVRGDGNRTSISDASSSIADKSVVKATTVMQKSKIEEQEFLPHLTVLRFRNPHAVKDLISPFLRKKWGEIEVSELILYKSELRGLYPVYTPLFTVPLTGTQEDDLS
jgi:2'-5' RNA ligase